jgi:hypothetical protein
MLGAVVAFQALFPIASLALDGGDPEEPARQEGEDRWVPSLAITSGITIQQQEGFALSGLLVGGDLPSVALQPESECQPGSPAPCPPPVPACGEGSPPPCPGPPVPVTGDDLAVSPFVGGSLELMAPALPIPTRPRLFLSGEILPTFASDRKLALDGNPSCVSGPEPDVPCARNEPTDEDGNPLRDTEFGQGAANGQGINTTARVGTLVFGASLGVAFPVQVGKRQLRIKPSVGWINYEVEAEGLVVDAACDPPDVCTNTISKDGFLRETILTASDSQRFNGIGPGLDVEVDTGRFGPLGVSLFLGGLAYRILGDRTIAFGTITEPITDDVGTDDVAFGSFEVEVDPWMFRAHVGIRFNWLGSRK